MRPNAALLAAQVEERRQTAYKLYLRGQLERDIGRQLNVSQGRISQYLSQIRKRNIEWFEAHKDPHERRRSLYKEVADQYRDILGEQWKLFDRAEKDGFKALLLGGIKNTLDSYSNRLGLVIPSMDEAWTQDQMRKIDEATKQLEKDRVQGPEIAYSKWKP